MATKAITSARSLQIAQALPRNHQRGLQTCLSASGPASRPPLIRGRGVANSAASGAQGDQLPSKAQVLTLLHNTSRFLPRALGRGQKHSTELDYWQRALGDVWDDLSTGAVDRKMQVAVFGMDEWAGSEAFITALLQDPLASTDEYNAAIRDRWNYASEGENALLIEEGPTLNGENKTLRVPSSWFQRFPQPTQLLEYPPATPTDSNPLDRILLKADIPIILLNPLTTSPSFLLKHALLLRNPNTIILISAIPSTPEVAQHVQDSLIHFSSGAKIIFVEPHLALRALSTLASDPKNARNVEKFQHDYTRSNIALVNGAISAILEKFPQKPGMVRAETALSGVRLALEACRDAIKGEEQDLDAVFLRANELRGMVEEAKVKAHAEVLGAKAGEMGEPAVEAAMSVAAKDMKGVMDYLTWWRMLGRVDEIGVLVGNA
ncbi:hypothetical protein HWV62_36723, partial [Athelia sp. TMB]